jgi:hypothetical protein
VEGDRGVREPSCDDGPALGEAGRTSRSPACSRDPRFYLRVRDGVGCLVAEPSTRTIRRSNCESGACRYCPFRVCSASAIADRGTALARHFFRSRRRDGDTSEYMDGRVGRTTADSADHGRCGPGEDAVGVRIRSLSRSAGDGTHRGVRP